MEELRLTSNPRKNFTIFLFEFSFFSSCFSFFLSFFFFSQWNPFVTDMSPPSILSIKNKNSLLFMIYSQSFSFFLSPIEIKQHFLYVFYVLPRSQNRNIPLFMRHWRGVTYVLRKRRTCRIMRYFNDW